MRYGRSAAVCTGLIICQAAVCTMQSQAYDAPSGIGLSLGSAEVDRASLAENDLVEIPIYISNNPGFTSLNMIIVLDEGLRFDDELDVYRTADELVGPSIYQCDDSKRLISVCFEAPDGFIRHRFTDDGELGRLRIRVDRNIPDGRYGASFKESGGIFNLTIFTYDDMAAKFGAECFSLLEGGGITVGNAAAPVNVQEERPADNGDIQRSQPSQDTEAEESGSPQENTDSPVTTAAAVTSAVTASASVTTTVSSSATTTTAESTTIKTSASAEASSTTNAIPGETETRKRGGLPFPVIAAAVIAAAAAVGLVSRKRR